MKSVAKYRRFAEEYRKLSDKLDNPKDKKALQGALALGHDSTSARKCRECRLRRAIVQTRARFMQRFLLVQS